MQQSLHISISPSLAEPFETQALLRCRAEELQSSGEPAAKIPPWAHPVPQRLAGVLFYSDFLRLPLNLSVLWSRGRNNHVQGLTGV